MKYCLLLLLIGTYSIAKSQSVDITLVNKKISIQVANKASSDIVIESANFNYQLYLSVFYSNLPAEAKITFPSNPLNYPYTGATMSIEVGGSAPGGEYMLIIKAANGPIEALDTCYVTIVDKDCDWEKINLDNIGGAKAIVFDNSNIGWINSGVSLTKYQDGIFTQFSRDELDIRSIRTLTTDNLGFVWLATDKGLIKFKNLDNLTRFTSANSQLPNANINDIAIDIQNRVWMATDAGVVMFDGLFWVTYNSQNSPITSKSIKYLTSDSNNNVWIVYETGSTYDHAVAKFDGSNWSIYPKSSFCVNYFDVRDIEIDKTGNVWLICSGTSNIIKWNTNTTSIYNTNNNSQFEYNHVVLNTNSCSIIKEENIENFEANYSNSVSIKDNGEVWVSSPYDEEAYVYKYKDGNWTTYSHYNSSLPNAIADYLTTGPDGKVYLITRNGPNTPSYLSILDCQEPVITSTNRNRKENTLLTHPNPAVDYITLKLNGFNEQIERLTIFDSHGNEVSQLTLMNPTGNEISIDISKLSSGLYIINLFSNDEVINSRFVKK